MKTKKPTRAKRVTRADAEEAIRTLLRWSGEDPSREGLLDTPKRVVTAYRDWFSGYAMDPAAYLRRTFEEVAGYDEDVASFWRKRIEQGSANVSRFIADGQKSGAVNPSLDPSTTADLIVWGVERVATQHVTTQPADEDDQLALRLAAAFWSTLGLNEDWQSLG